MTADEQAAQEGTDRRAPGSIR